MIDPELDQLSRALIAATDRLNSEDFRDRQSRYVRDELALRELGEGLEADERAVEAAQEALTAHVAANYLEGAEYRSEPTESDDGLFEAPAQAWRENIEDPRHPDWVTALPSEEDEYATAKLAGALS